MFFFRCIGGGIYNSGANNSIANAYFFENQAVGGDGTTRGGGAAGGALLADPGMTLTNVTFANNSAQGGNGSTLNGATSQGGALYSCELPLSTGITFSGNQAIGGDSVSSGGGSAEGGGVYVDCGSFNLQNATFINNKITAGLGPVSNGTVQGGGILVNDTLTNIGSSVFENNMAEVNGVITSSDCYNSSNAGAIVSLGYNLIGDAGNCVFAGTGDQVGVTASLLPLADNGCQTPLPDGTCLLTHGIDTNSNALDQGSCTSSGVTTDARGYNRPYDDTNTANADDACDVGAYEYIEDDMFKDGFE